MSTSNFDTVRFKNSLKGPETPDFTYRNIRYVEMRDAQAGSYDAGQIFWDLSGLATNNTFLDWQRTVIHIPYTVTMTLGGANIGNGFKWDAVSQRMGAAWTLKNSVYSLVNGFTLTLGNQTVVPYQQMSYFPIIYKLLTTLSDADVAAIGASINFAKDTSESISLQSYMGVGAAPDPVITGYYEDNSFYSRHLGDSNGQVQFVANAAFIGGRQDSSAFAGTGNAGRLVRALQQLTRLDATGAGAADGTATVAWDSWSLGYSNGAGFTCKNFMGDNTRRSWCEVGPDGAANPYVVTYHMYAELHCRFMHDIFEKLPLIRGALWQLTLHTNLPCTWVGTLPRITDAAHDSLAWASTGCTQTVNGFCPFMMSNVSVTKANLFGTRGVNTIYNSGADTDGATITTQAYITPGQGQCVINACLCDLDLEQSEIYMHNPLKSVVYEDFIRVQTQGMININGQDAYKSQVRATITSGMGNLRRLLIVPYLTESLTNGTSSCGGTALPYFQFTKLQVYISGRPLYDKPMDYSPDMYWREIFGCGARDGNAQNGFRVGQLNRSDFYSGYTQIMLNLERHAADTDSVPVSVDVEFTPAWGRGPLGANQHYLGAKTIAFVAYLFFDRNIKVDCLTGRLT